MAYATNSNQLTSLNGVAVQYDAAGNQVLSNALRYVYDAQGRLSEVDQASTQKVADYQYNVLSQRTVKRTFDPVSQGLTSTTTYLYGQSGEALGQTVYNAVGKKTSGQYWFWLDGMPLAQLNTNFATDGSISTSKLLYLHPDHLNTPRLATDSAQALLWRWNSDAYGVGTPNEDVDGNGQLTTVNLRFSGQVYDATSQLSYNYFRDYNPETGRYVQSDPIGLSGGINTYGYVGENPISYIDVYGKIKVVFFNSNSNDPRQKVPYNGALAEADIPTSCVVYAHGFPSMISDDRGSTPHTYTTSPQSLNQLKQELIKQGCTSDMPVVFNSCEVAQGKNSFAEQFSRVWDASSSGPTEKIWWYSNSAADGTIKYWLDRVPYPSGENGQADKSKPGSWVTY